MNGRFWGRSPSTLGRIRIRPYVVMRDARRAERVTRLRVTRKRPGPAIRTGALYVSVDLIFQVAFVLDGDRYRRIQCPGLFGLCEDNSYFVRCQVVVGSD